MSLRSQKGNMAKKMFIYKFITHVMYIQSYTCAGHAHFGLEQHNRPCTTGPLQQTTTFKICDVFDFGEHTLYGNA